MIITIIYVIIIIISFCYIFEKLIIIIRENVNNLNTIMKIRVILIIISKLFKIEFENFKKVLVDKKGNVIFINEIFLKRRRNCIVIV